MDEKNKEFLESVDKKIDDSLEKVDKKVSDVIEKSIPEIMENVVKPQMEENLKEVAKSIESKMTEEIQKLKDLGGIEGAKEVQDKERCLKFMTECVKAFGNEQGRLSPEQSKELAEMGIKSMDEGTATEGGNFVPPEFEAGVDFYAKTVGLARFLPAQFNTKSNSINYNVETAAVTVAYTGELVAIADSTPTNARITLTVKKLAGATIYSSELLEDADFNFVEYLMKRFGEAIALKEDTEFFIGTGANFTGILVDANYSVLTMDATDTSFLDISADYLRDMITQIPKSLRVGNKVGFTMSETVWAEVQKLKNSEGTYIHALGGKNAPVINGSNVTGGIDASIPDGYLWNKYPVWVSEVLPEIADTAVSTKFVAFGNYERAYKFYNRGQTSFKVSNEATIGSVNLFEQDGLALRVITRHAMGRNLATALVTLKTAAT